MLLAKPNCSFLCIPLVLLFFAIEAGADNRADAHKHFKAGKALYKAEDYRGAVTAFKTSVNIMPTKNGYFNLANCQKALHRYGDALKTIHRLEDEFGAELTGVLERKVARLKEEIKGIVAEIEILVDQSGASIFLGGENIGKSPLAEHLVVGPGEYEIQISLTGYQTVVDTVLIASGTTHTKSFVLEPLKCELMIETNIKGAELLLNGEPAGMTPLNKPMILEPGSYTLKARKEGYREAERTLDLFTGEKVLVDLNLLEMPSDAKALEQTVPPLPPIPPETPKTRRFSPLFWFGLSGTLLLGTTTGILWGIAGHHHGELESVNADIAILNMNPSQNNYNARYDALYDKAEAHAEKTRLFSNLTLGFGIGAGALALTTLIIVTVDVSTNDSAKAQVSFVPNGLAVSF